MLLLMLLAFIICDGGCSGIGSDAGRAVERGMATAGADIRSAVTAAAESAEKIAARVLGTSEEIAAQVLKSLDTAIATLDNNSGEWQSVLLQLERELPKELQTTIRIEVNNLLKESIAATGQEFRCNTDFVGQRVKERLLQIKARITGQSVPTFSPVFCNPVPEIIDYESVMSGRLTAVKIYGYNFGDISPMRLVIENDGESTDVTSKVDYPGSYVITINLGHNGVPLSSASDRLIFYWQDKKIYTIGVAQPQPTDTPMPSPVVSSYTASVAGHGLAACPADSQLIGGGHRISQNLWASSHSPHGTAWFAMAAGPNGPSQETIMVESLCVRGLPTDARVNVRYQTFMANELTMEGQRVGCGSGEHLLGGGYEYQGAYTSPDASYPDQNGWRVSQAGTISSSGSVTVYAVCYSGPVSNPTVMIATTAGPGSGNSVVAAHAVCPPGTVNTGGGYRARIWVHPFVQVSRDNGWQVETYDWYDETLTGRSRSWNLTVYAVCVQFR